MNKINFNQTSFWTTVNDLKQLPQQSNFEIAICGRSNAGKSTMLNTLCNRTRLAFTSKTPGRTQHINYFNIANTEDTFLVDLPGYGYAKVPESIRKHWIGLLGDYLKTRQQIIGMVLIMDSRHPLKDLDLAMLDFFSQTNKPIHIVLSKTDKLNNQEKANTIRLVRQKLTEMDYQNWTIQTLSATKRLGIPDLELQMSTWVNQAWERNNLHNANSAINPESK